MKRSEMPIPDLKIGDRVKVDYDDAFGNAQEGVFTTLSAEGLTNEFICVGVEFDIDDRKVTYFYYPYELKKV